MFFIFELFEYSYLFQKNITIVCNQSNKYYSMFEITVLSFVFAQPPIQIYVHELLLRILKLDHFHLQESKNKQIYVVEEVFNGTKNLFVHNKK